MPNSDHLLHVASLVLATALGMLALLPFGMVAQIQLAFAIICFMFLLRPFAKKYLFIHKIGDYLRILFILLGLFLSFRYLFWRTFNTIPTQDPLSFTAGLLVYLAEVFAVTTMAIGAFVSIYPLNRPIMPLPEHPSAWPSVDVLIPTYNETEQLLEITLLGALNIDYPRDKLRIYLLDDGGTLAKRGQADPFQAATANERHSRLRELCRRLGIQYLARDKNEFAKAGNFNAALDHIHGDLVLILDADHVPTNDILINTVGWFERDPKLALVQSPHFFIGPDPIEKNLKTFQVMPSEQEMFYTNIQRGLDFWNASFFCGSAAILRRRHLDEVGGLQGITVTEDAETSLALHARGYRSAYIRIPMVAGLQPESFISLVKQRVRWAQGMTQLLLLKNPLRLAGLAWWQKLSYLNSLLFWMFPFARIVFLLAPSAYLLFGLGIYDASIGQILIYTIPHLVAAVLITDYLYGNARWVFVSEFYELVLSMFMIKPLIDVLRSPHHLEFDVTAKGEISGRNYISPLIRPIYIMLLITLASILVGLWRYQTFPLQRDTTIVTLVWAGINLILLFGSLGALLERLQKRTSPRIPYRTAATLYAGKESVRCETTDLSVTGVGVVMPHTDADWPNRQTVECIAIHGAHGIAMTLEIDAVSSEDNGKTIRMGLRFAHPTPDERARIVNLIYGDSSRWRSMLRERNRRVGIFATLMFLLRVMLRFPLEHFRVSRTKRPSAEHLPLADVQATRVNAPQTRGSDGSDASPFEKPAPSDDTGVELPLAVNG